MPTAECIHGLDPILCDICTPRPAPEPVRAVRPTRSAAPRGTQVRSTPTRSSSGPGASSGRVAPRSAAAGPAIDLTTQRGYHVTHVDSLAAILADGALRAGAAPAVDLSSSATRELRAATELPDGSAAADRVPFYLTPDATRWRELVDGATGPAWSDAARGVRTTELVALAVPASALGPDSVLTDGDAAATLTRFLVTGVDRTATTSLLRRLAADEGALPDAELLGPAEVPFSAVALVIVPNDPLRERVRALLGDAGLRTKVAVNPPWFAAS